MVVKNYAASFFLAFIFGDTPLGDSVDTQATFDTLSMLTSGRVMGWNVRSSLVLRRMEATTQPTYCEILRAGALTLFNTASRQRKHTQHLRTWVYIELFIK